MPRQRKKSNETVLRQTAERLGIPLWGQLLIWGLVVVVGGLGGIYLRIDSHLGKMDEQLGKLRESVRVLEAQQPKAIQDTINSILQQIAPAVKSGNLGNAGKAAIVASALINMEKANKVEADARFFEESVAELRKISLQAAQLRGPLFDVKLSLAQYRSSLNQVPPTPTQTAQFPRFTGQGVLTPATVYPVTTSINFSPPKPVILDGSGAVIDARGMRQDQEWLIVATRSLDQNPAFIKDLILIGANQRLDYITWKDVTFVGTHIKYAGGPVRLQNVRFVDCTFDLPNNDAGARLAEYATLEPSHMVTVG